MQTGTPSYPSGSTAGLSDAEIEVLAALGAGLTQESTARELSISARTVRRRARNACDRLGVDTPTEAITWAARHGLI